MLNSPSLETKLREIELLREKRRLQSRESLHKFTRYTKPDYQFKEFHRIICEELDAFARGEHKRLMLFMPPQHGKSELSSRRYPAYRLGQNPNTKIAICSYSATLAEGFSSAVQQIMEDDPYKELFPESKLGEKGSGYKRTGELFQIADHQGFLKAVGVGGSLTGTPVDEGIIDDPFKDREEANSETIREKVWNWYVDVFETRMHNDSKILMVFTRWHEDDIAGRVLARDGEQKDGGLWRVIRFPGLKEDQGADPRDTREIGEALWEERHSKERLESIKEKSPRTFNSLYQQRPAPIEGNIIKKYWFRKIHYHEFLNIVPASSRVINFFLDTSYTDQKKKNDPSAFMATCYYNHNLYILMSSSQWLEFPDLVKETMSFVLQNGYDNKSRVLIEPKASGKSVAQSFKDSTFNVMELPPPLDDKVTRVINTTPFLEAGRCFVVIGAWNEQFIEECGGFPFAVHDDQVDNLTNAHTYYTTKPTVQRTHGSQRI
jgi:predicted phage terminase large subunit-like protein